MALAWSRLYLSIAAPVLVFLALLYPLGDPPDEAAHIARAASILNAELLGRREWAPHAADGAPVLVAGVDANAGYLKPTLPLQMEPDGERKPITLGQIEWAWAQTWPTGHTFIEASNTASYPPVFYVPAAIGLGLARLAGAAPVPADLAGRLAAALYCLAAGGLALRRARCGHAAFFALLMLPMTLHLSAAINQDGPLIATAVLAGALFTCPGPRSTWAGALALACVCAAKPAYLPLAAAALVPLGGTPWRWRSNIVGGLLIVGACLAWAAAAAAWAAVPFWRTPYHPGPLWPGDPATWFRTADPAAQLQTLAHDPVRVLGLPFSSSANDGWLLLNSAIGKLGSLDFELPQWLYSLWYVALGAIGLSMLLGLWRSRGVPPLWAALAVTTAACLSGYAVFIVQYFAWTGVGAGQIEGIQGRYFLPILALLVPALPGLAPRAGNLLAIPALAAAAMTAVTLPVAVVLRFYLR